jgi:hypothetical protein
MRQCKNPGGTPENLLLPGAMLRIERVIWYAAISAICVTSHTGRHKMVDKVRHCTISNSFITESRTDELVVSSVTGAHQWLSGLLKLIPSVWKYFCNFVNIQSLAAKPPTKNTNFGCASVQYFHLSYKWTYCGWSARGPLCFESLDNVADGGFKEFCDVLSSIAKR